MALDQLKYGGEEMADVVLGTYRPDLSHLGSLSEDDARAEFGDKFKQEEWELACGRKKRYRKSTFVQLLKNRPSMKGLLIRGVECISPANSMFLRQVDLDRDLDEDDLAYEQETRRAATG